MVRSSESSISRVTGESSWRSQVCWLYRWLHCLTADSRSCSCAPRWWAPVHTSSSPRPISACHINGGRSSRTTAIPTWLTGALVMARIAWSAVDLPRNSHRSPVRVKSTAASSGTFLVSSGQSCKRAGQGHVVLEVAYDLSSGGPLREVEDLAELVLGLGGFGEHPSGLGTAAGRGVDQDGLFDAGELVEEFTDREVQFGAGGFAAHQVGDL